MGWIVVRNWERFQHYKDRNVPWIKFYTELTHDDAFLNLTLNRRGILCQLWLEYATSRCRLRDDTSSLTRRFNGRVTKADLKALKQAGFITLSSRPNLEHVYRNSSPRATREEAETETYREEREAPLLPLDLELGKARLLSAIGGPNNGMVSKLERYGFPPAAWFAAAEEIERMGNQVKNPPSYVLGMFKVWADEGRYSVRA
jgi:hypothetical protein